jgi:hypothetical protein
MYMVRGMNKRTKKCLFDKWNEKDYICVCIGEEEWKMSSTFGE